MNDTQNSKQYDLEPRTLEFAKNVRSFVSRLSKNSANFEDGKQLIRSSGSVGANYIEANESLGKKDFAMRIKICLKEAKESRYWLKLLDIQQDSELQKERVKLGKEADELLKIFASILQKTK
ncbi:MAG: four helix bundle protein [Phycisphaerae bacterium]|nr:four helix bundle protein [Phycisphaerae bacterium]